MSERTEKRRTDLIATWLNVFIDMRYHIPENWITLKSRRQVAFQ